MKPLEQESASPSLIFIQEKLRSGHCNVFFDIDGTLKGKRNPEAPGGFDPNLPFVLQDLGSKSGVSLGAATSQSASELLSFVKRMDKENVRDIFPGNLILEDGHLWVPAGASAESESIQLLTQEAKEEIDIIKDVIGRLWEPAKDPDLSNEGWGFFPGVTTPVGIPNINSQAKVTASIWERGPDVHDPMYAGQYDMVAQYVTKIIQAFDLQNITCIEAGNGTLRILEKDRSKATAFLDLARRGVIDLQQTIFFCDGMNDIEGAKVISTYGGAVVTVANADPQIKSLATFTSSLSESFGVCEILGKLIYS